MTIEEVMFILRNIGIISGREGQAIDIAIEALEKQIPKKPTNEHCPVCNENLETWLGYCNSCGQKIAWS